MKTIIEPFKIKMVEPIKITTADEREAILQRAHFNVFQIAAEDVLIDLEPGSAPMKSRFYEESAVKPKHQNSLTSFLSAHPERQPFGRQSHACKTHRHRPAKLAIIR